jgi:hypothetical protein
MSVLEIMTVHRATRGEKTFPVDGSVLSPTQPMNPMHPSVPHSAQLASQARASLGAISIAVGKSMVRMTVDGGCAPAVDVTWYKPLSFANMLPTVDL